jgi:phage gp36-like protein
MNVILVCADIQKRYRIAILYFRQISFTTTSTGLSTTDRRYSAENTKWYSNTVPLWLL